MKKSVFGAFGLAVIAALFCAGCNDSGVNEDKNGEADAFLKWINGGGKYTVTFNPNLRGITAVTAVPADYGTEITLKDAVKLKGYLFTGWNSDSGGTGESYGAGERYAVTGDVTFYATWIQIDMVHVRGGAAAGDFYIGRYEVTQELWEAVMGDNPSYFAGGGNLPVERVSWDEAQGFIRALNGRTGDGYRLPSAAEWEFAARGGGNVNIDDIAWHGGNSGGKTHSVGAKSPNELGIYDMFGNVWEWVGDYFRVSAAEPERLIYGGGWSGEVDIYSRYYGTQSYRDDDLGFRLACD